MTIFVKNKHTLHIDDFKFKCCIGKKGVTKNKKALNLLDEMSSSRYIKSLLPRNINSSNRLRALWEIITESILKSRRV